MKRTILFASTYWGAHAPGGAEWTNAAWARALTSRGHRVIVVTPNYGDVAREEDDGLVIVRPEFPFGAFRHEAGHQREAPWLLHRNPLFHRWLARHIRRTARAEGAELVHAQSNGAVVGAWRAARALGLPFAVTIRDLGLLCPLGMCLLFESRATYHCATRDYIDRCVPYFLGHYATGDGWLRRARRHLALRLAWRDHAAQRRALAQADVVIGVSHGILRTVAPALVDPQRARVVHSPLPRPERPLEDPVAVRARLRIGPGPLVLYAGKRSPGKGTAILIDALDAIRAAAPGVRFVFAGKGDLTPSPRADVHVLGSVPQPTLFALYGAADVVVIPSVWPEPLSRVLIEAMYFGRAVVATRVGGTPELVEDGVTGLLVEPRDPAALAGAVTALLRDPARRAGLGAAAGKRVASELDEDRRVATLLEAYESVFAETPRGGS